MTSDYPDSCPLENGECRSLISDGRDFKMGSYSAYNDRMRVKMEGDEWYKQT
jgi:hypothetical protein